MKFNRYIGPDGGAWNNPEHWSQGTVPGSSDKAYWDNFGNCAPALPKRGGIATINCGLIRWPDGTPAPTSCGIVEAIL